MVKNKRGWIRILEATIAILIVSSVLVFIYSKQTPKLNAPEEYIKNLQKKVIRDIHINQTARNLALNDEKTALEDYANLTIPDTIGFSIKICDLTKPCKLDSKIFKQTLDKNVFVEEKIISANLTKYTPKKVRIFAWEKS